MKVNMTLLLSLGLLIVLSGCGSAPQRPVAVTEGERLLSHGVNAHRNDDLLNAANFFTKALSHYQGLDDAQGQLQSRINLTEVALAVGNLDAAHRHLAQAEMLATGELSRYRPRLLLLRSSLALATGDMEGARLQSEALLPEKLGGSAQSATDETILREALINRTRIAISQNDDSSARWIERLEKNSQGDASSTAWVERFRAALADHGGDHAAASLHLQKALDICKEIASRRCIAGTLDEWGAQLQAAGDLSGAEDRYQRALTVRLALLDRGGSSKTLRHLADICQSTGRNERAATLVGWADTVAGDGTVDWRRLNSDTLGR